MPMVDADKVKRVAVLGAGTIGASWTAGFLAQGMSVSVWDPDGDTEARVRDVIAGAWPALKRIGMVDGADPDAVSFHATPAAACEGVEVVQENAPERLEMKVALYDEIEAVLSPEAVISSSTSSIMPSVLQASCKHPGRLAVGHPFNPPHLIPCVEVVGGEQTDPAVVDWLMAFYEAAGKQPIRINKEMPGHLINRLQMALWREVIYLVNEGVASVGDADKGIAYGPGLRWALMGPTLTFHMANAGGMPGFLDHFGEMNESMWNQLGDATLDAETRQRLIDGVEDEAGGVPVAELRAKRDDMLIAVLEALAKERG
jgi:carnitine 3-dehydrogenase